MSNKIRSRKCYRPSATVIIAVRDSDDDSNYKILLTKRSLKTEITTDHYVFPGGVHDVEADDNSNWIELYDRMGITDTYLHQLDFNFLPNRPTFLQHNYNDFKMARDISLRITAIREIFEEIGLLLCLTKEQIMKEFFNEEENKNYCGINWQFNSNDAVYWQEKVHNNAKEFYKMCQHFQIVPDLWKLYEWSAWRSPVNSIKKYDTVFYIVGLKKLPVLFIEPTEVAGIMWAKPNEILQNFKTGTIWLPGSLFYEISRLARWNNWLALLNFAKIRSLKGCTLLKFVYYTCKDCVVAVLPGDDYYIIRDLCGAIKSIELPFSSVEFAKKTKNLHRLHYKSWNNCKILITIQPFDGHLQLFNAIEDVFMTEETKSKL